MSMVAKFSSTRNFELPKRQNKISYAYFWKSRGLRGYEIFYEYFYCVNSLVRGNLSSNFYNLFLQFFDIIKALLFPL